MVGARAAIRVEVTAAIRVATRAVTNLVAREAIRAAINLAARVEARGIRPVEMATARVVAAAIPQAVIVAQLSAILVFGAVSRIQPIPASIPARCRAGVAIMARAIL